MAIVNDASDGSISPSTRPQRSDTAEAAEHVATVPSRAPENPREAALLLLHAIRIVDALEQEETQAPPQAAVG